VAPRRSDEYMFVWSGMDSEHKVRMKKEEREERRRRRSECKEKKKKSVKGWDDYS
jgi:hypothetical protein